MTSWCLRPHPGVSGRTHVVSLQARRLSCGTCGGPSLSARRSEGRASRTWRRVVSGVRQCCWLLGCSCLLHAPACPKVCGLGVLTRCAAVAC